MFIMFNMHVHVCVHACMHAHVCLHGAFHIPTPTHTSIYPPHLPPNQLKCYNTLMNQDISILFEDLKICVDSPTYGWVYGFVDWLMDGSFF